MIFHTINRKLQSITMYNVVLYTLFVITLASFCASALGLITYSPLDLLLSFISINVAAITAHLIFQWMFRAPAHLPSTGVTALLLFLILYPSTDQAILAGNAIATIVAIASKYLLAFRKQHFFNPAAFGAAFAGISGLSFALWWIGNPYLLAIVAPMALLVVAKMRRFGVFAAVLISSTLTVIALALAKDAPVVDQIRQHFLSWPIVFFAAFMITEPYTAPVRKWQQYVFALFIGIISSWPIHAGSIYSTPELTLLIANFFAFFTGMKQRLLLKLEEKRTIAKDTVEFIFSTAKKPWFLAGQYLEWTLPHASEDNRGIRRYFTIASAPTEDSIRLGIKFNTPSSSFKTHLAKMKVGETITASQLGGNFVLPKSTSTPLVFVAGGIGVTPFRSMLQYAMDQKSDQPITLFYCNKTAADIAYKEFLASATEALNLTPVHVLSDDATNSEATEHGFINKTMVEKYVKNHQDAIYYLSGPSGMVDAYKKMLTEMGIKRSKIKTDYFPGFA